MCRWVLIAWAAICAPVMSVAASFGTFSAVGGRVNFIMVITPMLVLGIGVDDAFLLMHAWFGHGSTSHGGQ